MNTRWKITLAFLLAILAAWLVVRLTQTPEPSYQGKTISEWLDDRAAGKPTGHEQAIQAIGTNALPCIIRCLVRNDSEFWKAYRALYTNNGKTNRVFLPPPMTIFEVYDGGRLLLLLGTNSIPHAIVLLKHRSPTVREAAANGLSKVLNSNYRAAKQGPQALPALIEALEDMDLFPHAAWALGRMGPAASNAIPALTKVLADTHVTGDEMRTNAFHRRRAIAAHVLGEIGPSALSAVPYLKAALQETYPPYFPGSAAHALLRINGDLDGAMPALRRALSETNYWIDVECIWALGEMGPRAKAAVPLLQSLLGNDNAKRRLGDITNALNRIDPERLGKAAQESRPAP